MLKAIYARRLHKHAPLMHNLLRLARLSRLEPDEAQTEALLTIAAFTIEAHYPDLKRAFRPAPFTPQDFIPSDPLVSEIQRTGVRLL